MINEGQNPLLSFITGSKRADKKSPFLVEKNGEEIKKAVPEYHEGNKESGFVFPTKTEAATIKKYRHDLEMLEDQKRNQGTLLSNTKIEGLGDETVLTVPLSRDYLGVYIKGRLVYMVKKNNGHIKYSTKDLVSPESVGFLESSDDLTPSEKEKKIEAQKFYYNFFLGEILDLVELDYGFPVRELTVREQIWFVDSIRRYSLKREEAVTKFTKKFGLNGARAFLSCEYGDKFRKIVFALGEKLPENLAHQVFEQYGRLVLLAQEKSTELIHEFMAEGKEIAVSAIAVEQELLRRAKNFLVEISQMAEVSPEMVAEKLAQYETDMVIFAGIFKTTFKDAREVNFKDVRGLGFEQKIPSEITEAERKELLAIFGENWSEQKPEAAPYLQKGLEAKLDHENQKSRFFILKKDGKIIAFVRFDQTESPNSYPALYAASLNIKKDLRGSAMGEAVLKNTVDQEAIEHIIFADVFPELQAGTKYVEDFGCVIVGVAEFPSGKPGQTETRLLLRRDDRVNGKYLARSAKNIEKITPEGVSLVSFSLPEEIDKMIKTIREMEAQGKVGTRYFSDPTNKKRRYIAFEDEVELPSTESISEALAA